MVASMFAFAINDALIKSLGGVLPLFQTLTLRGILVVCALAIMVWMSGGWRMKELTRRDVTLLASRTLSEIGAAYCIVKALFNMPLADMTAILQILPLAVPLAARLFLGEALGWRRMAAICVGFLGMLMIVQPGGQGFSPFSIYALAGVVFVTWRDITARMLGGKLPTSLVSFYAALGVLLFAGAASTTEVWQPITPYVAMALLGSTIAIVAGYNFSVLVMRNGDIPFTSQFRYMGLIAALGLGYAFFGEWPNLLTQMGALVVVCMGLFTLYRERKTSAT